MSIELDIEVGDIVLTGKFKNKRTKVKTIGTDELGQPTINGKPILKLRIEKLLPKEKQSKETREAMTEFNNKRLKQLAGLLKEQDEGLGEESDSGEGSEDSESLAEELQEDWRDQPYGYGYTNEEKLVEKAIQLTGAYGDRDMQLKDALRLLEKTVAYLRKEMRL